MTRDNFFVRKEQAKLISKVYSETPLMIRDFFRQESELLQRELGGTSNALEVGCGFGRVLNWVPQEVRYFGMDISIHYVQEGKEQNPRGNWICGDATSIPAASGAFDSVFCIQNTLGNMEGIEEKVLGELRRVCRKGGKVILSVYSEDSFEKRRLWYDRLVDAGIFRRVWLDPANRLIARSDTGWSSRSFEKSELRAFFKGAHRVEITKVQSFLYFCVAEM